MYNNVGDIIEVNTLLQVNLKFCLSFLNDSLFPQVKYDGSVTWLTQGIYTSKCDIDVKYYPMDAQNCSLKFASWSQEVTKLNLSVGLDISDDEILSLYTVNKEFELKDFFAVRHETPDPCCTDNFADVT